MAINPKIENYIEDLKAENFSFQLAIYKANKSTIPNLRKRLLGLAELIGMAVSQGKIKLVESLTAECSFMFVRLIEEIAEVYDKMAMINDNLTKIKGLKNGTIKEI